MNHSSWNSKVESNACAMAQEWIYIYIIVHVIIKCCFYAYKICTSAHYGTHLATFISRKQRNTTNRYHVNVFFPLYFVLCNVLSHSFKLQKSHFIQIAVDSEVYVFGFVCMSNIFLADRSYQVEMTADYVTAADWAGCFFHLTRHAAQMSFTYLELGLRVVTQCLNNGSK